LVGSPGQSQRVGDAVEVHLSCFLRVFDLAAFAARLRPAQ
jgi:hypothetical protein